MISNREKISLVIELTNIKKIMEALGKDASSIQKQIETLMKGDK